MREEGEKRKAERGRGGNPRGGLSAGPVPSPAALMTQQFRASNYSNYKVGAGSGVGLGANLGLRKRQVPGPQAAGMDPGGASCPAMAPGPWGIARR